MNEHWILGMVDIFANKIFIYDSMVDYTKDLILVKKLLLVADMIPLLFQKITNKKSYCTSNNICPINVRIINKF